MKQKLSKRFTNREQAMFISYQNPLNLISSIGRHMLKQVIRYLMADDHDVVVAI